MGWISTLLSLGGLLVALPVLALFSAVLVPLAIVTTSIAAFILGFRVVAVYVELGIGLVADTIAGRSSIFGRSPALFSAHSAPTLHTRPKSARSTTSSTGSQTSINQIGGASSSLYASNPLERDFEGIGGWRVAADEDEESDNQWLTMNSRLELPVVSSVAPEERWKHHQRRATSSSLPGSGSSGVGAMAAEKRRSGGASSGSASGGVVRTRAVSTAGAGGGGGGGGGGAYSASGATTPVEGQARVRSMTQMGEALAGSVARGKTARRKNSTSSSGSERTLVI